MLVTSTSCKAAHAASFRRLSPPRRMSTKAPQTTGHARSEFAAARSSRTALGGCFDFLGGWASSRWFRHPVTSTWAVSGRSRCPMKERSGCKSSCAPPPSPLPSCTAATALQMSRSVAAISSPSAFPGASGSGAASASRIKGACVGSAKNTFAMALGNTRRRTRVCATPSSPHSPQLTECGKGREEKGQGSVEPQQASLFQSCARRIS